MPTPLDNVYIVPVPEPIRERIEAAPNAPEVEALARALLAQARAAEAAGNWTEVARILASAAGSFLRLPLPLI